MNTRNRGAQNSNSFSLGARPKSLSTSRNNISIELQDPPTISNPRVAHSPAAKNLPKPTQQAHRAQSFSDLPTNTDTLPQNFVLSGQQFYTNFSVIELTNNPSVATGNVNVSNSSTPFDTLITMMEQTMRNTREEFRRELSSIRDSISQIGSANETVSQRRPVIQSNKTYSNTPSFNSNPNSDVKRSYTGDTNIKLEKWKIVYDGTGSVLDFLFKVETLTSRTRCSDEHLLSNFHVLLEGRAEQWYWLFMKQNREVTYQTLRYALTKEFGYLESEHDILFQNFTTQTAT
ncbi:hypothetical protein CVS40_11085 [Lucilia cuprina]|nr:hypothetical protein CVS40_11085 [Lucilia cuprina]